MKNLSAPRLTLIGAGPGSPDLISLRGLKALAKAREIFYDALVSEEFKDYAPFAKWTFVGKRAGRHYCSQEEINRSIARSALRHGEIARLKGGDPFLFGRGHEELVYAQARGIEVEVIPGISSVNGVSGLAGLPLTLRGVSESFWVVTGTTKSGSVSADLQLAARSSATVVILMGMRKLSEICEILEKAGRADLPAAIIQNGSLPNEKIIAGRTSELPDLKEKHQLGAPAIIVSGEVVAHIASPSTSTILTPSSYAYAS